MLKLNVALLELFVYSCVRCGCVRACVRARERSCVCACLCECLRMLLRFYAVRSRKGKVNIDRNALIKSKNNGLLVRDQLK